MTHCSETKVAKAKESLPSLGRGGIWHRPVVAHSVPAGLWRSRRQSNGNGEVAPSTRVLTSHTRSINPDVQQLILSSLSSGRRVVMQGFGQGRPLPRQTGKAGAPRGPQGRNPAQHYETLITDMRFIGAPSLGVIDENATKAAPSQKNVTDTQRPKVPRGSGIRYKEKTSAEEGSGTQ